MSKVDTNASHIPIHWRVFGNLKNNPDSINTKNSEEVSTKASAGPALPFTTTIIDIIEQIKFKIPPVIPINISVSSNLKPCIKITVPHISMRVDTVKLTRIWTTNISSNAPLDLKNTLNIRFLMHMNSTQGSIHNADRIKLSLSSCVIWSSRSTKYNLNYYLLKLTFENDIIITEIIAIIIPYVSILEIVYPNVK